VNGALRVGVTRPHVSTLGVGPRPRLRPALEGAVSDVDERLGERGRIVDDRPIEFVWGRRAPLTVLRETRVHASWHVSPSVVVQIDGRRKAAPAESRGHDVAVRVPAPPPAPMRLATIERRIEMRVVGRALGELTEAARRPVEVVTAAPAATAAPPQLLRGPAPRRPLLAAPAPAPAMTLARSPSGVAAAGPAANGAVPIVAATGATHPPAAVASPPAAPLPIDRITTEVVRALDARVIAWRERMGRP